MVSCINILADLLVFLNLVFTDRNDTGVIEFEDLKNALIKYGDALDDDDIDLLQKALNAGDNKVIVDGKFILNEIVELY